MAQVGRISGPLLEANLLRQGIANGTQANLSFKNTNSDTTLLKVDVANGRIGVDLEAPANELQISQTIQTVDAIAQTADIGNFNLSNTDINVNSGDLYLKANEAIVLSNLETEQFYASDNFISTKDTNASIELKPSGTGTVESNSINVRGNLHSTNNITLDGNIIFGDTGDDSTQLSDTVSINADINSNVIPTISDAYSVGSNYRSWDEIHTHFVNGQLVNSGLVTVNNIAIDGRVGNIFYVAANGSNNNVGDHPQGPLATIEEALSRADASTDGPVMIKVFAGEYEENLPLVVPNRVSIIGNDFRNVVIKPAVGSESKDVFHLDDSTLISNLTIKDFYYDSGNNTGYAFRFSPGAVITNRSPYIQDVTVITKGSVTSASDPRGFDQGDAGKGAYIDGAELDSASVEASMLFHAATFITPGVDAITMTNGVRVEWLNSFTYFANRGLYAVNGVTGRTSYDGSTVEYGAELRAIGSANIYGNYGAVADGADTLMYLIQHNMAYIGTGKFVDNDASRAIYNNEITELNNGVIHYSTTDHLGGFRIGDNFWVDFETGNTTINIDTLSVDQFTGLRVNTNNTTTVIDGAFIDTGNLTISNNLIEATNGDLNVASATGQINLLDNTNVTGNVNVTGNLGFGGTLNIAGNEATDSLSFNTDLDQSFNPHQHQTYALGSFEKKWLQAHLDRIETSDFSFFDNVIQLNSSNADIELRASGTGKVNLPSGANISNNFTVVGDSVFNGTVDVTVPNFPLTGDLTTFGNLSTTGNFDVDGNVTVGANAQFAEILFDSNFITTTTSNADLELRASGTGTINLQENVNVTNNLSADNIDATNITATLNVTADNANIGDVEINDNYIETTSLNGDLILSADRNVIVTGTDTLIEQDLTINSTTTLNSDLNLTGTITQTGNTTQTGNVTLNGEWTNGNIEIEDNFISTTQSNSNLELRASSTGEVLIPNNDLQINNNLTVSTDTDLQGTTITGTVVHAGDRTQDNTTLDTITDSATMNGTAEVDGSNNFYLLNGTALIDYFYPLSLITIVIGNDITVNSTGYIMFTFDDGQRVILKLAPYTAPSYTPPAGMQRFEIVEYTYFAGSDSYQPSAPVDPLEVILYQGKTAQVQVSSSIRNAEFTLNGELTVDNVYVEDNFITTNILNTDLELRAPTADLDAIQASLQNRSSNITDDLTSFWNEVVDGYQRGDINNSGNINIDDVMAFLSFNNGLTSPTSARYIWIQNNIINPIESDPVLYANYNTSSISINVPQNNVEIDQNLTVNGTTSLQGTTITGTVTQTGNRTQTGNLDVAGEISNGNILIEDNFITTTNSNSDLELRASGTGSIILSNNTVLTNNVTVNATSNFLDTNINGTLTHTGDRNDFGASLFSAIPSTYWEVRKIVAVGPGFAYATWTFRLYIMGIQVVDQIKFTDNNLAADHFDDYLTIEGYTRGEFVAQPLSNSNTTIKRYRLIVPKQFTLNGELAVDDVYIEDNFITTTASNANLELRAPADSAIISLANDLQVENNFTANLATLQGTSITGTLTHVGDTTHTGALNVAGEFTVDNVYIEDNFITTTAGNLTLEASGTGNVLISDNLNVTGNLSALNSTVNDVTVNGDITHTGNTTQNGNLDVAGELTIDNVQFEDNFITTTDVTVEQGNLKLFASGTGNVVFDAADPVTINNNLTVKGTMFYNGSLTINGNVQIQGNLQDGSLTVSDDFSITGGLDVSSQAQFEEILIEDNFITTTTSNANLELRASGTGEILVPDDNVMHVNNNLFTASITTGNINVNQDLQLNEIIIPPSVIEIDDNFISTRISNANLELRANGSGVVQFNDNTTISENLISSQTSNLNNVTINGLKNHIGNLDQTGTNTLIGDMSVGVLLTDEEFQFGDVSMSGNLIQTTLSNSNLELRAAGTGEVKLDDNVNISNNINVGSLNVNQITSNGDLSLDTFELSSDIRFFDNVITTTNSNSNLELRAAGTANIHLENFRVNDNRLFTEGTSNLLLTTPSNIKIDATGSLKLPTGSVLERITALDTFLDGGSSTLVGATLDGGNASTVFTPTDTIYNSGFAVLVASGNTGDIRFNTDENVFEGTSADTVTFGGVFSSNRLTSVTADPYSNNIRMMVNGAIDPIDSSNLVGEVTGDSFRIHGLRADEILLDNNTITTFNSNSDLELRTDGTGELSLEDISLKGNLIKNNGNNTIIRNTGFGKTKFPDTYGVVIPYGNNTTDRPVADPEVGDVRWNQSDVILEAWNGTQYQSAAGVAAAISEQEFNDLLLEFTLIFG